MVRILEKPAALSFSGNLTKFLVESDQPFAFSLKKKSAASSIFEHTYYPGTDKRSRIDVSNIIEDYLYFTLQANTNVHLQPNIKGVFVATIDTQTVEFEVIRGGISNLEDTTTNWLKHNFLTWQPIEKNVTYHSPEWISWYAISACALMLDATFEDQSRKSIKIADCQPGNVYTANLQYGYIAGLLGKLPSYYDVYLLYTDSQKSQVQRYLASDPKNEDEIYVGWENSLGGYDVARMSGYSTYENEGKHEIGANGDLLEEYNTELSKKHVCNTGLMTLNERFWFVDFFISKRRHVYIDNAMREIVLSEDKGSIDTAETIDGLSFTFREKEDSKYLNVPRLRELPSDITIPVPSLPDFNLPPRLVEYARITLDEGVLFPAQHSNSQTCGVTTWGAMSTIINNWITDAIAGIKFPDIPDIPETLPPGPHTHQINDVVQLKTELEKRLLKSDVLASTDTDTVVSEENVYSAQRAHNEDEKRLLKETFNALFRYDATLDCLFVSKPIAVQGGVTMFADAGTLDLPSIYDGIPLGDGLEWRNGQIVVTVNGGLDEAALGSYLTTHKYATQTWVTSQLSSLHTHSNKSVLDAITSGKVSGWDSAYSHISDTTKHITASERVNWNTAFGWGNHAAAGYALNSALSSHISDAVKHITTGERNTWNAKENALGNPITSGYLLSSTTTGTRSWVKPYELSKDDVVRVLKDADGCIRLDAHMLLSGGLSMLSSLGVDVPSIFDNAPIATPTSKGMLDNSILGTGLSWSNGKLTATATAGTFDHASLNNRNAADQHVIASITGLQSVLDGKLSTTGTAAWAQGAHVVSGVYTSNGGHQEPSYVGRERVRFNMMNTDTLGNVHYKNWLLMDCYGGDDVGGATALGIDRQSLGLYIMRSNADRTTWNEKAALYGTHNANRNDTDWNARILYLSANGIDSSIGSLNGGHLHYHTTAESHWFSTNIRVAGQIYAGANYADLVWNTGNDSTILRYRDVGSNANDIHNNIQYLYSDSQGGYPSFYGVGVTFSQTSNLQLHSAYNSSQMAIRTRNHETGAWNGWSILYNSINSNNDATDWNAKVMYAKTHQISNSGINSYFGGFGTDTYLWTESNHDLKFGTNNIERLRITKDGLIGINCSHSPAITLAIGDNDTGFSWLGDGTLQGKANGIATFAWTGSIFEVYKPLKAVNPLSYNNDTPISSMSAAFVYNDVHSEVEQFSPILKGTNVIANTGYWQNYALGIYRNGHNFGGFQIKLSQNDASTATVVYDFHSNGWAYIPNIHVYGSINTENELRSGSKAFIDYKKTGGNSSISLAIGDSDTGLDWESDGIMQGKANGVYTWGWSPSHLWTTGGKHLVVGSGGDAELKTRHVSGKHWQDDSDHELFLNWRTQHTVNVGGVITAGGNTSGNNGSAQLGSSWRNWNGFRYPLIRSSHADGFMMHYNPHICYAEQGRYDYWGATFGSIIRFECPVLNGQYDIGVLSRYDNSAYTIAAPSGHTWRFFNDGTAQVNNHIYLNHRWDAGNTGAALNDWCSTKEIRLYGYRDVATGISAKVVLGNTNKYGSGALSQGGRIALCCGMLSGASDDPTEAIIVADLDFVDLNRSTHVRGNLLADGGITMLSDMRLKNRISNVKSVLPSISEIDVFRYTLKSDTAQRIYIGVSAQQIQGLWSEFVHGVDTLSLDYAQMAAYVAIKGLQETKLWMDSKDKKIAELEKRIVELERNVA